MIQLLKWATRHTISPQAVQDLLYTLGLDHPATVPLPPGSVTASNEATVQSAVRLEHARRTGGRLFRNNCGVATAENGTPIRYGLCNDSKQLNAACKSSDLIGITPVRCSCGVTHGLFTAYECKSPGWKFRPSDSRAVAQLAFGKLVLSLGGLFKFVTSKEDIQL